MEILITLGGFVVLFFTIKGLRNSVEELARSVRGIEGRFEPANFAPPPPPPQAAAYDPAFTPAPPPAAPDITQAEPAPPVEPVAATPEPVQPAPVDIAALEEAIKTPGDRGTEEPPAKPRDYGDFERRFGTQWVVWVGGIALALGGIFLVRYSIEAGLFTPGLRIIFGAILALVLIGLGELARRREISAGISQINTAHIPSILTAAGTTVAYADVYAAYALYDFLSPGLAFVLLGLVALGTLSAALIHGPWLGGLGLIGAYVTPALVSSAQPNYWALYVYLAVVTAAAYALARVRLWRWLAITAAVFSLLWMLVGIAVPSAMTAHAFHAVAGFALACTFIVAGLVYGPEAERGRFDAVSWGVLAGYLFGAFLLVLTNRHETLTLLTLFALGAATIGVAWRSETATPAVPVAALLALLIVGHWATSQYFVVWQSPGGPLSGLPLVPKLDMLNSHLAFGAGIALMFGAAGFLAQGRPAHPLSSILWAAAGVLTPVIALIALYYGIVDFERSIPFAAIALLLAILFAYASDTLGKRDIAPGGAAATAIFACGGVAALALALTFALEKGWLTVSLALMVPGIAWISTQRPLPMLRPLCTILVALVMLRIMWDPRIVGSDVGKTPILNWLLWGYGVPAVSFWFAGHLLRKRADDTASRTADAAAITFTALTAFLEIRHLMNDGDIYRPAAQLGELGLQVSTGLAMTIGLEHVRKRSGSIIHDIGARIIGLLTFAAIWLGLMLGESPMRTGDPVGGTFFNYILLGYGIPAVLMGVLARMIRETRPQFVYIGAAITTIVLALTYLTLEVRTIFHGPVLTAKFVSDAEDYTYSAVWLAFGVALLLAGIALGSKPARFASAAVVILTIAKVFLHDLAGVQGIYRAFSFICLGLVLIGIGWLYQRLLFPPPRPAEAAPQA
jgi:uncharacterized membrane protein